MYYVFPVLCFFPWQVNRRPSVRDRFGCEDGRGSLSDGPPGSWDEVPALTNVPTAAGEREATIMCSLPGALSPTVSVSWRSRPRACALLTS